jgi:hypothetical protein
MVRPAGAVPPDADRYQWARAADAWRSDRVSRFPLDPRPLDPRPLESRPLESRPLQPRPLDPRPLEPRLWRSGRMGTGIINFR